MDDQLRTEWKTLGAEEDAVTIGCAEKWSER